MITPRRIGIAEDEPAMLYSLERMVRALGHQVAFVAGNGEELIRACEFHKPELVITDIVMPGMDGIEAAEYLWVRFRIPVILVSAFTEAELVERALTDPVFAYLVKPIEEADLETAIRVTMAQFQRFVQVLDEAAELRQSLADRKLIEKAKGIVMQRTGLSEDEAHRKLQKLSWDRGQKMAEIAQRVIEGDDILTARHSD